MESNQNLSQQTVKCHKGAIQTIYSVCLWCCCSTSSLVVLVSL